MRSGTLCRSFSRVKRHTGQRMKDLAPPLESHEFANAAAAGELDGLLIAPPHFGRRMRIGGKSHRDPGGDDLLQESLLRVDLSDGLAQARRGDLDGAAPFPRRRDRFLLRRLAGSRGTVAEFLRKIEVRQDVEMAAARRLREQPVVLVVEPVGPLLLEASGRAGSI